MSDRAKHVARKSVVLPLAFAAGIASAAPPDPPSAEVTRIPVELRVPVAELEKQIVRQVIQKIDPTAKPELPFVVKGNTKDAPRADAKEPEKTQPPPKVGVLPPAVQPPAIVETQPVRPGPLRRPIGSRVIERAVIRPAIDMIADRLAELPNLDYRIELRSLNLAISGQTLTCEVGGGFYGDGKSPTAPVVRGDLKLKLTVTKELAWTDTGKLELKEGKSQVRLDPPVFRQLDTARAVRRNGLPTLLDGVVDRMVMAMLASANTPDLARIAPKVNEKLPFLTLTEIEAYPLRGDGKDVFVPLVVGLTASGGKTTDVKTTAKSGPPPEPQVRGRIVYTADGKPEVKLDPPK